MKAKASVTAQKLLNLYRQAHVIVGGWAAVNRVFVDEADDEILRELQDLPTGHMLIQHIENLRSGVTPMDTIESELLPYGGLIASQEMRFSLSDEEIAQLKSALDTFETTPENLKTIKNMECVRKFGADWVDAIKSVLSKDPEYLAKWDNVVRTSKAYQMWDSAKQLVSETLTERNRAQIQADMPEFETYLPMFGDQGRAILAKLRTFMSSAS